MPGGSPLGPPLHVGCNCPDPPVPLSAYAERGDGTEGSMPGGSPLGLRLHVSCNCPHPLSPSPHTRRGGTALRSRCPGARHSFPLSTSVERGTGGEDIE